MWILWVWMLERHNGSRLFWHVNPTQMDEHPALGWVNHTDLVRHDTTSLKQSEQSQRPAKNRGRRGTEDVRRVGWGGLSGDQVRQMMIQMIMCPSSLWLRIEGGRPLPLIIWVSGPGAGGPTWRGSTSQTNAQTHTDNLVDLKGVNQ